MHKKGFPLIVIVRIALLLAVFAVLASAPAAAQVSRAKGIQNFHLVSEREGWVLIDQTLYWTKTAGQKWDDITPPGIDGTIVQTVSFLDARNGWLVLTGVDASGTIIYTIVHTDDGGSTWYSKPLSLFEPGDVSAMASAVHLSFLDAKTGWLVIKRATSSNFSVGALFKTTDGGETWTQLTIPIGESVYFITDEIGWTAGGAAGDEIYRTTDGGWTWQFQVLDSTEAEKPRFYHLPTFTDAHLGALPVLVREDNTVQLDIYITKDSGESWRLELSTPLNSSADTTASVSLSTFADGSTLAFLSSPPYMTQISDLE